MTQHKAILAALTACAMLAAASASVWGQARGQLSISTPGSGRVRIGRGVTSTFSSQSYGLSMPSTGGGRGGGVLSSSIGRGSMLSSSRSRSSMRNTGLGRTLNSTIGRTAGVTGRSRSPASPARSRRIGGVGSQVRVNLPAPPVAGPASAAPGTELKDSLTGLRGEQVVGALTGQAAALASEDNTAWGAARAYVQTLESASASLLRESVKPVTSLVPPETAGSTYRDYMAKGDSAFRQGNYRDAFAFFQIANDLGDQDAESYICMLHAQFAMSHHSYARAAHFLQQAIRQMPELPLANLRPKGFYGDINDYGRHAVRLTEHVRDNSGDGDAQFVLAYLRWFGRVRDVEATRRALASAMASALADRNLHRIDAIDAFWRGMVNLGVVNGSLSETPGSPPSSGEGG